MRTAFAWRRGSRRRGVTSSPSCAASRSCARSSSQRTSSSTLLSSPFCPPSHDETGDAVQSRIELHCTLITTAQQKKSESCGATTSRERRRVKQRARVSCAIARRAAGRCCDRRAEFNDVAETCMRQGFLARRRNDREAPRACSLRSFISPRKPSAQRVRPVEKNFAENRRRRRSRGRNRFHSPE